jgi:hypothetical protein
MKEKEDSDGKPTQGFGRSAKPWLRSVLSWPTFAILCLLLFWTPLREVGRLLPRVLENSETFTWGKMTLQIRQNLKSLEDKAGPDVRDALSGMESEDVMTVLESKLENTLCYSGEPGDEVRKWQRLKRLELVVELSDAELRQEEKRAGEKTGSYYYGVRPTAKYDKVHQFLAKALFEIVTASVKFPQGSEGNNK